MVGDDFSKLEARVLFAGATQQTLFEEARRYINQATTPATRNLAKRDMLAFLYGNSQPIKDTITLPIKELPPC